MWLVCFNHFIIEYLNRFFFIGDTSVCKLNVVQFVTPINSTTLKYLTPPLTTFYYLLFNPPKPWINCDWITSFTHQITSDIWRKIIQLHFILYKLWQNMWQSLCKLTFWFLLQLKDRNGNRPSSGRVFWCPNLTHRPSFVTWT